MTAEHTLHKNQILKATPAEVKKRLFPHMNMMNLPLGMVLNDPGDVRQP